MNEVFESLKQIEILSIKKVKTYSIGKIVILLLSLAALCLVFFSTAKPARDYFLKILFIIGILADLTDLILNIFFPEKHYHWKCKLPKEYKGWEALFLVSTCISYSPSENIVIVQFLDELEPEFEKEIDKIL